MDQPSTQPFADEFGAVAASLAGCGVPWIDDWRQSGLGIYGALGLPTRRVEAWKYTDLRRLPRRGYVPAQQMAEVAIDSVPAGALALDGWRLVLVNGRFRPGLSIFEDLPAGVAVANLGEVLARDPAAAEPHLGKLMCLDGMPLAALNTAFAGDGLYLRLEDGVALERPVHLVSIGGGTESPVMFHPRHLIVLGAGASATVVESHIGLGDGSYLANGVLEAEVGRGAALRHARLQRDGTEATHLAAAQIVLGEGAAYEGFVLQAGGRLVRHEARLRFAGPGAEGRLAGAALAAADAHLDNMTLVDHAAPGCRSRQLYKGAFGGRAKGIFQGKTVVRPGAQGTDAYQMSRALLLSKEAEADTKPELEIYADDVTCGHGATVGDLDAEALFYLSARGIGEAEARRLLVEAFLAEAIDTVSDAHLCHAFTQVAQDWLEAHIGGGAR